MGRAGAQVWLGVGIGFILAGIMVISWPSKVADRQEVERQARALGMVYRDEVLVLPGDKPGRKTPAASAEAAGQVAVYVPPGATSTDVAELLARAGVVADARAFDQLLKEMGVSRKLRAGSYSISVPVEPKDLVKQLTRQ